MDGATSVAGFGCKAKHLRKPKKKKHPITTIIL